MIQTSQDYLYSIKRLRYTRDTQFISKLPRHLTQPLHYGSDLIISSFPCLGTFGSKTGGCVSNLGVVIHHLLHVTGTCHTVTPDVTCHTSARSRCDQSLRDQQKSAPPSTPLIPHYIRRREARH